MSKTAIVEICGVECEVQRVPLAKWTAWGRVPGWFANAALDATEGERKGKSAPSAVATADDNRESLEFQRAIFHHTLVSPKVALGWKAEPGEVLIDDLDENFFDSVVRYGLSGSPDVAVSTEGGEVAQADLGKFPADEAGQAGIAGTGESGSAVSDPAVVTARDYR